MSNVINMNSFRCVSRETVYTDLSLADVPFDYTEVLNAMAIDLAVEALIRRLTMTLTRQESAVIATRAQLEAAMQLRAAQMELPVDPKPKAR